LNAHTARGTQGIVATGHALASEAALAVLKEGGNAVDAATMAALVLAVVCPYACTLGGDLYALVYDPRTRGVSGLNATGCAPGAASLERFAAGMPPNGVLSATIPGLLRGLADLQLRFGTRALGTLLAPAIRLAAEGFAVHRQLAANTADRAELLARDEAARALFLPGGKPLADGAHFVQPALAETLRRIAVDGVDALYAGEIADEIAASSARRGGLIARDDLASHVSLWQDPIAAPFYGHDILTMPPNSYGATLLFQLLELESGGIASVEPESPDFIRRGYTARRNAYRVAARLIADPRLVEGELRHILARACAEADRRPAAASPDPTEPRDRCTTCAVVIDRDGMAVSLIESVSAPYGAGVVLDGTGILLNNRMAGFNTDPASPNCVAPAKRPANTLAPCLVLKDGRLAMSVGTPGTVGQTCTLAQFLARVLACGEDPAEAVAAPRWSVDFKGKLVVEDTMEEGLRQSVLDAEPEARAMRRGWISFGSIKAVTASAEGLAGVADSRRAATTLGW
jgi:gamma-glutamyltranspeptidase / glutathione hydrolase